MATITSNLLLDLIGVFVALLAVVYTFFKWSFSYWKKRNVPVVVEPSIPFGNLENPIWRKKTFGENIEDIYFELRRRKLRYGGTYVFSAPELLVADPEIVRCVLAKDFHHFVDRGLYHDEKANPLTGHLFLLEGAKWKNLRAKLTPTFTSGKMKMMFNTLVECSGPMIRSVEKQAVEQTPIDIKEVLGCFTTDIIGSCAFGLECKSFEGEEAEFRTHGRKLFTPTPLIVLQNAIAISLPRFAKALRLSLMPKDEIDFFLNIVRDNIQYRERNNFRRNDFFQLLMDIKKKSEEDGGKPFTVEEFAAQVFLFFVAGFETSSTTMTFAFYELSRHPDIQKKVRQEVNEVLKRHDGQITYEAIQDMKLLRCVIDGKSERFFKPMIIARVFSRIIEDVFSSFPPIPKVHQRLQSAKQRCCNRKGRQGGNFSLWTPQRPRILPRARKVQTGTFQRRKQGEHQALHVSALRRWP